MVPLYQVAIVFKNGSKLIFDAQEFDLGLAEGNLAARDVAYSQLHKLTYKDALGNEAPMYLDPTEVAGIAVVRVTDDSIRKRSLHVA